MSKTAPARSSSRGALLMAGLGVVLLALAAGAFLLWQALAGDVGARFATEQDFVRSQNSAGWRVMGRYTHPLDFPARVSAVQAASGGIQFTRPDGVPHDYSNFPGKDFRLYTFQPDDASKSAFVILMVGK